MSRFSGAAWEVIREAVRLHREREDAKSAYARAGEHSEDPDPDEAWRSRLYSIDVDRALGTRRGLQRLTELRAALLALPEKRLALGQACRVPFGPDDELDLSKPTFCAMGAWLHRKRVEAGEPEPKVVEDLSESRYGSEDDTGYEAFELITNDAKRLGMARVMATQIQWINDRDEYETEEDRYTRVLAWTERAIADNPHHG